ncbi:conserved hypothetical protein [Altererythrobacter sp. B11]|uniref:hypothetical protein n=1 Tax=Altererythrobacter sp. B11 TaxID=2060312 RepID=UPI000DC72AEA|nr:hypothetical protein [Altererythrobacter sp. B11]BBC72399.1 conserved hypothetical protein [Altererythrobacter sp. B11]
MGVALLAAGCAAQTAGLPRGAHLVAAQAAPEIFHQCSREAPEFTGGSFVPEAADIARLESALAPLLSAHAETPGIAPALRFAGDPASYARQYAGYTVDGRRMIYGNFVPGSLPEGMDMARQAAVVCDGGAGFFGVEYDVARQAITRVAFNGSLNPPRVAPITP